MLRSRPNRWNKQETRLGAQKSSSFFCVDINRETTKQLDLDYFVAMERVV